MSDLPIEAAAPNWTQITTEPQCPLCEYMLRGLNVARCPECGFRFNWPEVLDTTPRKHPYLFEHHPERNVWSFFKTVFGVMRPRRFWSQMQPDQSGSSRRLLIYWIFGLLTFAVAYLLIPTIQISIMIALNRNLGYNKHGKFPEPPFWEELWRHTSRGWTDPQTFVALSVPLFIVAIWPWITYVALQVFGILMRKARVKPFHVSRCVIYSLDAMLPACLLIVATLFDMGRYVPIFVLGRRISMPFFDTIVLGFAALAILLQTYRLGVAYRRYLRIDQAPLVVISSQLIALLIVALLFVLTKRG